MSVVLLLIAFAVLVLLALGVMAIAAALGSAADRPGTVTPARAPARSGMRATAPSLLRT